MIPRILNQARRVARRLKVGPAGTLEPLRPSFDPLFPAQVAVKEVATGFEFTEGPIWRTDLNALLFSDIPANRIFKLDYKGKVTSFREPSGNSNGLTLDKQGRLIACEHGNQRVTRIEMDGSITVLADEFEGKPLNSPNDVVVKNDGAVYFTDPPYGRKGESPVQRVPGVYRLAADGGRLSLVADDFVRPNGLAFSPDEKKLYIGDSSERRHIRVFDVNTDGSLSGGKVFAELNSTAPGAPDGMKLDVQGNIYCAGPGGVWLFNENGEHLGTILTREVPANCAWGDPDFRTLYITARTSIYKVRLNTEGIRVV